MTSDAMTSGTAHGGPPAHDDLSHEGRGEVRIIGANRAGGVEPPLGGIEASPGGADEPAGNGARSHADDSDAGAPEGPGPGFGPEDWQDARVPVEPALPHWTEAPTGEVPAVLSRHESDDDDPWAALPEPSWREGHADWAQEEPIAPVLRGHDEEGGGLLGESDMADRQPWSFDLGFEEETATEAFGDDADDDFDAALDAGVVVEETRLSIHVEGTGDELAALDAGQLFGAAAPPRARADETAEVGPGGTEAAQGTGTLRVGRAGMSGDIAGEKTSILRVADIAAGAAPEEPGPAPAPHAPRERAQELEDAAAAAALQADLDERAGGRVGRPGLRRPGARKRSPGPHPGPSASGPSPRGPRPAPAGARGAGAASSTLRRGDDAVSKRTGRNITAAILSGVAIGAVALIAFDFGTVPSMVVVTAVVALAAMEAFGAFRRAGYRPATLLGLVAVVGLLVATYDKTTQALPVVVVLLVAATFFWHLVGVDRRAEPVRSIAATLLVFCWVGVFGSFAALLLAPSLFPHRTGIAYLLGALIAAVAYDVGALAVGAWAGRHPLSAVSPGKTWEGLVGGAVLAIVVSIAIVHLIHPWSLKEAAVLGVVVAVVSPIGDLCESLVKRHLGLKDMGRILPGHGGVLDRVDGLLFVLPATYYLVRAFH